MVRPTQGPRVWASSYLLVTFACIALLEHELLLGQEVVREYPVELPNLIELGQFGCRVVAEVTDQLAHVSPVLLLDVSTVVAMACPGPGPGEGDLIYRPPGRNVSDRLGETVFARRLAALMANQVDLHKPGDRIVPLGPGADRNLRLQQCPRLGMGPAPRCCSH